MPFAFWSRFNVFVFSASDALGHDVVKNFIKNGEFRDSLTNGIFISSDKNDNLGRLENALKLCEATAGSVDKIKLAIRNKTLPRKRIENLLDLAREKSIISTNEFVALQESFAAVLDAMEVDEYSLEEYKKI